MTHLTIEYLTENSKYIASFLGITEELEITETDMFGSTMFYLYYGEDELIYPIRGDGTKSKDPVTFRKYVILVSYGLSLNVNFCDYDLIHNYSFSENSKYNMSDVINYIRQQKVGALVD